MIKDLKGRYTKQKRGGCKGLLPHLAMGRKRQAGWAEHRSFLELMWDDLQLSRQERENFSVKVKITSSQME